MILLNGKEFYIFMSLIPCVFKSMKATNRYDFNMIPESNKIAKHYFIYPVIFVLFRVWHFPTLVIKINQKVSITY